MFNKLLQVPYEVNVHFRETQKCILFICGGGNLTNLVSYRFDNLFLNVLVVHSELDSYRFKKSKSTFSASGLGV